MTNDSKLKNAATRKLVENKKKIVTLKEQLRKAKLQKNNLLNKIQLIEQKIINLGGNPNW